MSQSKKYPAQMYFSGDYLRIIELLEDGDVFALKDFISVKNINLDEAGTKGLTLLAWLALSEETNAMKTILTMGANPNQIVSDGKNKYQVLSLVIGDKTVENSMILLDNGADPNSVYNGEPVIYTVIMGQHWDRMKLLMVRGADINKVTNAGISPVLACAMSNQFEQVAYLIERGADFNKKSLSGGSVALEVQEYLLDTNSLNGQWRNKVKQMLEQRGIVFPVKRPWEKG